MEIIITSILMGIGLAMDACAVSMANGLKHTKLKISKILFVSFIFGLFQGIMPLVGYLVGHAILSKISWIIPIVALTLLSYVGEKMIADGLKYDQESSVSTTSLTIKVILIQAIATSIDALSAGFSISDFLFIDALICVLFVTLITFSLCVLGVYVGKKFGSKLGGKAQILGGIILIFIGLEIFISHVFF